MYVTRPKSFFKNSPDSLSSLPEGPHSGFLVIQDRKVETCCFGLCSFDNDRARDLPFPQNYSLTIKTIVRVVTYSNGDRYYRNVYDHLMFIPVLNQPLSSNLYYVISRDEPFSGEALTCSKELSCNNTCCIEDVRPRPLDPSSVYQQFKIVKRSGRYFAGLSTVDGGFPPEPLRRINEVGWKARLSTEFMLDEAPGLDKALRACMPRFDFPLKCEESQTLVVGKWYCPFMFVREGTIMRRYQMSNSMFYVMTLEQQWKKIFSCSNSNKEDNEGKQLTVDVVLENEAVYVGGFKAEWDEGIVDEGAIWFRFSDGGGAKRRVGLSPEIVERMKWEQEREGWRSGKNRQVRITRAQEFKKSDEWREFGLYVLVERFVLRRMDGTLVMEYHFLHDDQIKSKWE
ncbi:uncharacterized protein LOC113752607 [Coffea eugenioides]|uniref:uncharacterized protein LOC113752607 n=1 Tax=Coffea eugenioides TaxID=49369 RepID=UPI000F60933A|nr:uncharacterized protein LOC113752607 [Coffea eugenioides]